MRRLRRPAKQGATGRTSIAAWRESICSDQPTGRPPMLPCATQIGSMPVISAGGDPPDNDPLHRSCSLSPLNLRRIRATPPGGGWQDWPLALRVACHRRDSGKTYPSVYGRMRWDDLAPDYHDTMLRAGEWSLRSSRAGPCDFTSRSGPPADIPTRLSVCGAPRAESSTAALEST